MLSLLLNLAPAQASGQPSPLISLAPMVLIFVVFYLVWFMPLRKRQKEHDKLLGELQKGDKVILNSGIHGKISRIEGDDVYLEVADKVSIRVTRRAIGAKEGSPAQIEPPAAG
jgi:preprotein translocase subunit YajC